MDPKTMPADTSDAAPGARRSSRGRMVGLVAGAVVMVVAPLAGMATTAILIRQAFGAVAGADPSDKARLLADGISSAMDYTAGGMVLGLLGSIAFIVSLVLLLRQPPCPRRITPPHHGSSVHPTSSQSS